MESRRGSLYIEIARCLGCHSCELACALEHAAATDLAEAMRETPRPVPRVHVEPVNGASIPLQCRHCEDAPCVAVCPTQAMHKLGPGLPVLVDEVRCIGCKLCVLACPFGVVTLREEGRVALKCDLCVGRGEQGLDPACVSACKTQALQFLSTQEIARRKRLDTAKSMQLSQACEGN